MRTSDSHLLLFFSAKVGASLLFPHNIPKVFSPTHPLPQTLWKRGEYTHMLLSLPRIGVMQRQSDYHKGEGEGGGGNLILGSGEGKESLYLLSSTSRGEFHGKERI